MVVTGGRSSGPPKPDQPTDSPFSTATTSAGLVSPARRGRQRSSAALHPDNAHTTLRFPARMPACQRSCLRKEYPSAPCAPDTVRSVPPPASAASAHHAHPGLLIVPLTGALSPKEGNRSHTDHVALRHTRHLATRRFIHRLYPFPRRDTPAFWTCPARDSTERWRALRS